MAKTGGNRVDGRRANELRPVNIIPDFVGTADGSCLIEVGGTRVICTASITPGVPTWREASGLGWVTAEYGMLPASTGRRKKRPLGKPDSRGVEIQRLIGRVLRGVVRFNQIADMTISLDCDVLEADGGTRTAAITGAYVALARAVNVGRSDGRFSGTVLSGQVAAVSVGMVDGRAVLDLCYAEDSAAEVDMNLAMTASGKFVDIQGTSEGAPFSGDDLQTMLRLGRRGIRELLAAQKKIIAKGRS
ncbi:MAG: ribonuclease PH [Planctomycetes bacterium]|jgi:ribonuclease PH|nr:ribonuclease PH [Phycisphaerae bacterium]NBB96337.1 ribonuclease PH [Planctomycetota bacterium]